MSIIRAEVIAKMRGAVKKGLSASKFIRNMKEVGLSYRRSDMLADWRNISGIRAKENLTQYVRKGYVPAERSVEIKAWNMSQEYMYVVKCQQIFAGVPADKSIFMNLMHDTPQTIESLQIEAWERSVSQSPPRSGEERHFVVQSVLHRAEE